MKRSVHRRRAGSWLGALSLPLLLAASPLQDGTPAKVTELRLTPQADQVELVVVVDGTVSRWTDFTLTGPDRLVLDLHGARNALPRARVNGLAQGGVSGVRASQYSPDVVRVVVDLQRRLPYTVEAVPEGVRVSFAASGTPAGAEPAAAPAPAAPEAPAPQARPEPRQKAPSTAPSEPGFTAGVAVPQPRITVTFQDADIRAVLASFAEFSGRSIVPGSNVQGQVNATIRDQPWDIALQTILRAQGLAAREMPSGIIQVDDIEKLQERQAQEPLVTETFQVNYVPVADLAATLETMSTDRGRIAANTSTNTLIVTDVESVVDNVRRMMSQLDVRTPQVAIQAKIIFVNRTDVEELGVVYDLKDFPGPVEGGGSSFGRVVQNVDENGKASQQDIIAIGGNSVAALGNAAVRVQGPQLETVVSLLLGRFTLVAWLEALQSAELSDVQAAPLITTLDNQEAEIWVGERTPIRVVDVGSAAIGGGAAAAAPRATAELVETGIRLRVTPHITADRRIMMQLHAERSSAQLAATDIGVIFQQQQGRTRLMVEDGETAVIGGLTVTEVSETRAGIPILMDLPVVGRFFQTRRQREQKRDLLIMVTPRIVDSRNP